MSREGEVRVSTENKKKRIKGSLKREVEEEEVVKGMKNKVK